MKAPRGGCWRPARTAGAAGPAPGAFSWKSSSLGLLRTSVGVGTGASGDGRCCWSSDLPKCSKASRDCPPPLRHQPHPTPCGFPSLYNEAALFPGFIHTGPSTPQLLHT